jgi:hypothetical protein
VGGEYGAIVAGAGKSLSANQGEAMCEVENEESHFMWYIRKERYGGTLSLSFDHISVMWRRWRQDKTGDWWKGSQVSPGRILEST